MVRVRVAERVLRLVVRRVRSPGVPVSALLCWIVALSVAGAALQVLDWMLFRPPEGIVAAEEVRRAFFQLTSSNGSSQLSGRFSHPQFEQFRQLVGAKAEVAAYSLFETTGSFGSDDRPLQVALVSPGLFDALGTRARVGQLISERDSGSGRDGEPSLVLSEKLWRRELGGDPRAVGQIAYVNGRAFRIIGVVAGSFTAGEAGAVDAWVPFDQGGDWVGGVDWRFQDRWWLSLLLRVRKPSDEPGVADSLRVVIQSQVATLGVPDVTAIGIKLESLLAARGTASSVGARGAAMLARLSLALLALATVSVAGLYLLRQLAQCRDNAIMRSLGATSFDLRCDLAIEIAGVGLLAILIAIPLTVVLGRLVWAALSIGASSAPLPVDVRFILLQGCAGVGSVVFAIAVALVGTTAAEVHAGERPLALPGARRLGLIQSGVVAIQSATATAVLATAFALVRGLAALSAADLGIAPENVHLVTVAPEIAARRETEMSAYFEQLLQYVRSVDGVESASIAVAAPFLSSVGVAAISPDDPRPLSTSAGAPLLNAVTPGYFATIGTRIVRGRSFLDDDLRGTEYVMIVNEVLARLAWPGADPIGRCLWLGDRVNPCFRVVGVAQSARRFSVATEEDVAQVYVPLSQNIFREYYPAHVLLVKTRPGMSGAVAIVAARARQAAPSGAEPRVRALAELIDPQLKPWRTASALFSALAMSGLLTAVLGAYGAVSFAIRQAERESAVRLALGASRLHVVWLAGRATVGAVTIGVVLGVAIGSIVLDGADTLLPGIGEGDVVVSTIAAASAMMALVGTSVVPLRRVGSLNLTDVLRRGQ